MAQNDVIKGRSNILKKKTLFNKKARILNYPIDKHFHLQTHFLFSPFYYISLSNVIIDTNMIIIENHELWSIALSYLY